MQKSLFLMLLTLLVGATLLTTACNGSGIGSVAQAAPPVNEKTIPVAVAEIKTGQMDALLSYAGTLAARDSLNIMPKVGGRINQILVEEGEHRGSVPVSQLVGDRSYALDLKIALTEGEGVRRPG